MGSLNTARSPFMGWVWAQLLSPKSYLGWVWTKVKHFRLGLGRRQPGSSLNAKQEISMAIKSNGCLLLYGCLAHTYENRCKTSFIGLLISLQKRWLWHSPSTRVVLRLNPVQWYHTVTMVRPSITKVVLNFKSKNKKSYDCLFSSPDPM